MQNAEQAAVLSPAKPIPGVWYDADYFEHGLKSNWAEGYTWPLFRGVFGETAEYLIKLFPDAVRFLDVGCAKGFLVKALRAKDRDAWGFDHSPWAIDQAENAAKPFLSLASIDNTAFDKLFDVVVAMSLFESLTEEQIRSFLPRARSWTRQAIFATISTVPIGWQAAACCEDRDLSHIVLRDRDWWRERFLEAGWRQDPIHKIAERMCQADALPAKMGWTVYVFSPGE